MRVRNGWVQYRGLIYATATPANGNRIFVTPYPPVQLGSSVNGHHFVCAYGGTTYMMIRVESGGDVDYGAGATGTGASNWISLDTLGYWID